MLLSALYKQRIRFEDGLGFSNEDWTVWILKIGKLKQKKSSLKIAYSRNDITKQLMKNFIYIQKFDISQQITIWRDLETDEITDNFDWQRNLIFHLEKKEK